MPIIAPIPAATAGFYEIPGYSKYVISPEGEVRKSFYGTKLWGYPTVDGYHTFGIIDDNGVKHTIGRHRLLCLVFKNEGIDYTDMQVNHKNNTPGDDWLGNLEWTTAKGNIQHAAKQGRMGKRLTPQTRCVVTGKVEVYTSAGDCARANGISYLATMYRLKHGPHPTIPRS